MPEPISEHTAKNNQEIKEQTHMERQRVPSFKNEGALPQVPQAEKIMSDLRKTA